MNTKHEKLYDYLGITLDFVVDQKKFIVEDYIENMFDACPFLVEATEISTAWNHLFQVNTKCEKSDEDKKAEFI